MKKSKPVDAPMPVKEEITAKVVKNATNKKKDTKKKAKPKKKVIAKPIEEVKKVIKPKRELTDNQKLFCEEYLIDRNATRAYSSVYTKCKPSATRSMASKLMTNSNINAYIEERMNSKIKKLVADQDEILETFTKILRGEEKDQMGFETSIKDRISAGKELAKRYGLFNEPDKGSKTTAPKIHLEVVDNSDLEAELYKQQ